MKNLLILSFLAFSMSLSGARYYLATDGNDTNGTGSLSSPYYSLEKAWGYISAGDTIYLRGGLYKYSSRQDLRGKDGKAGYRINIWAYPGELPIITKSEGFDLPGQTHLIYIDADYLHVKGLEISFYQQQPGIKAASALFCLTSNSIFENLNYHHNALGMFIRENSSNNLILNCDFHNNYDPYDDLPYNHADGLDLSDMPAGTINTVKGCRFYENSDDGLDLWNNNGKVIIDSCWAWNNGYREDGITIGGDGSGFKLGMTSTADYTGYKRILTNSISASNRTLGISQNSAYCKIFICNNTLYENRSSGIYFSPAWGDAAHMIKNNISYKNTVDAAIKINNPIVDHNSWQLSNPITDEYFISVDKSQLARPRNVDGSLPEIEFMKPNSDCLLIDAGTDVGLPYWGDAPDIGAFEKVTEDYHLNQLPLVSIVSPTKNLTYTSPANVDIDIMASDPDGSIVLVELFNGPDKIDQRTTFPYSFTLKDLSEGKYSLKAVATDNKGAITTSAIYDLNVLPMEKSREYFNLYPNPNNGRFTVDFSSLTDTESFILTVVDLIGNTVFREEVSTDESTRQFDLSHLNSGIYVLMISAGQILLTQKLILNRLP